MMNRRVANSMIAGTVLGLIRSTTEEWITVAHTGKNLNDRSYTVQALQRMADTAKGKPVARCGEFDPPALSDLLGMISEAEYISESVRVRVKWFSYWPVPTGQFISPWGVAQQTDGSIDWDTFQLLSMRVSESSAFQHNTRVS